MSLVRLDNARDPEQLRRMKELEEKGECHFCGDVSQKHTAPIVYQNMRWFVVANDFPYSESVHHYLVVSKKHFTKVTDLFLEAQVDLFDALRWLERFLEYPAGYSIFVRSGDMAYTSGTLDHLHIHFLVGTEKSYQEKDRSEDVIYVPLAYKKK